MICYNSHRLFQIQIPICVKATQIDVTPRKRRVSRNDNVNVKNDDDIVTPRKRRVSRNEWESGAATPTESHASQEACE